jgi:hypothetical protein
MRCDGVAGAHIDHEPGHVVNVLDSMSIGVGKLAENVSAMAL